MMLPPLIMLVFIFHYAFFLVLFGLAPALERRGVEAVMARPQGQPRPQATEPRHIA